MTAALVAAAAIAATPKPARGEGSTGRPAVTAIDHIHGLGVDPFESQRLWVATHRGLLRVTDRWVWTRVGSGQDDLMGFTVHPSRRQVLFTSGHPGPNGRRSNPLGVTISRDGGLSWETLALAGEADFHAMAISAADPRIIYAWNVWREQGFFRSRDGGRTWEALGRAGLSDVHTLRAHPQQPATVLAATDRGLLQSRDGGRTWTPVHPGLTGVSVTALDMHPRRPSVIYAYTGASHLGLVNSTDAGRTWISLGFHQGDRDAVTQLALDPAAPSVLYMATVTGSLFWSGDGGRSRRRMVNQGRVGLPQ